MEITGYLSELVREKEVYFKPNPGNAGDSLIAYATFQLLNELGINYRTLFDTSSFDPTGKVLLYGGGGNFVEQHKGAARDTIEKFHRGAAKLIILPSTITGNEDILSSLGSNVDIICREMVSYHYVKSLAPSANVYIMDDMAFSLDIDKLLSRRRPPFIELLLMKVRHKLTGDARHREVVSPKKVLRAKFGLWCGQKHLWRRQRNMSLNCVRTDSEASSAGIPKGNIDLSEVFSYGAQAEPLAYYSTRSLIEYLQEFDEITTNRLHLGIAGAILGKSVRMFSNSYYKCRAVYEYSMKDRFPNVEWLENPFA